MHLAVNDLRSSCPVASESSHAIRVGFSPLGSASVMLTDVRETRSQFGTEEIGNDLGPPTRDHLGTPAADLVNAGHESMTGDGSKVGR